MRLPVAGACLALLLQTMSASPLQQQSAAKGSIEGVVTRSGTGDPIPGARVMLNRLGTGLPPGAPAPPPRSPARVADPTYPQSISSAAESVGVSSGQGATSVLTDSQGRFAIRDLDSGRYTVSVAANGYARQDYGMRSSGGQGTPVNLNSGQIVSVGISLLPTGSVSGRVRDNRGQPAVGIQVQVLKTTYNSMGQRSFQSAGSSRTDDRGEYRLFWVTPGHYYVMASNFANPNAAIVISSPNEVSSDGIAPTFYPGSMDISQAAKIDLKSGADIGGVDVIVSRQPAYRIRGRLVDIRNGQSPAAASITLVTPFLAGGTNNSTSNQSYNGREGTFEIRDVSPGPHIVRAQLAAASNTVTPGNAGTISTTSQQVSGQIAVNVTGETDGVLVTLSAGVSIPGRLTLEGPAISGSQGTGGLSQFRVQLRPSTDGVLAVLVGGQTPQSQAASTDGTFRVDNVMPGEYRVSVAPLSSDVYVKQARFNQTDVLNKPMQFSSSDSGTLEVVLSSRGGRIDGSVTDEMQRGVQGLQAVLIPDRQRDRIDLYKTATSDVGGAFTLRGIAPGEYQLFAWEAIDPYAYFDPDLLKQYESKGKPVHIAESAKENVDVRMIPAEP